MMKFLRSQSQTVLWVVLGVIALGFLFYGNSGNFLATPGTRLSNDFGRIDGEDLSTSQLFNAIRNTRYSIMLGSQAQMLNQPNAGKQVAEEAWRRLLLLHEADRLHINVSDRELIDYIHNSPLFQDEKTHAYSPQVYQTRMTELQNGLHISPDTFENIIRDNLRVDAVNAALFASVRTSARDVSEQYQKYFGPTQVSLVSFDPKSFADASSVTPDEIASEYKAHSDNPAYRTKEKRKVDYVLFPLSPDQAKLPDKEKAAAKQALGEKALDFALAFQPDPSANGGNTPPPLDFATEAKKRGLTPATTDFFTVDTPPANMPPSPSFNNAAFSLTKENPVSKVIDLDNGVAVLHLADAQPSELRPLDEVKADIAKQIQQTKASQAVQSAVQNAAQALKAAVAKGTDFKAAAAALNLKVETIPAFVPMKVEQNDPRLQTIAYVATSLAEGQVSGPVPVQSTNGTLIVHLDGRTKADPAGIAEFEGRFRNYQDQQLRQAASNDWVNWQSKKPGTHRPPDLDQYGGVE
jgi:peptidyl-prolyl cis-trans isomerase D